MTTLQNLNEGGAAIQGYDPVSYFQGNPAKGDENISTEYKGASYYFTNASNKSMFDAAPEKYVPQYGGFCAVAISEGKTFPIDPNTYIVDDDKLYLFYNGSLGNTKTQWEEDPATRKVNADNYWQNGDITVIYPTVAY